MSVGEEHAGAQAGGEVVPDAPEPDLEQQDSISGAQEGADGAEGDESSAAAETEVDWRQEPEILELAHSAGIPPGELEDYADAYELERAIRLADRRHFAGLERGDAGPQPPESQPARQEATPPAQPPARPEGQVTLPALDREVIDEPIADAIEAVAKHYEGQLAELSSQFNGVMQAIQQQELQFEIQQVLDTLESLGHEDLFGKGENLRPGSAQYLNRERVLNAYSYLPNRTPTKAMVLRAVNQEFWSDLKKGDRQAFRKKLEKQQGRVLPGRGQSTSAADRAQESEHGGEVPEQDKRELVQEFHRDVG